MFTNSLGRLPIVHEARKDARAAIRDAAKATIDAAKKKGLSKPPVSLATSRAKISIGFGPRREEASREIREATTAGRLPVYIAYQEDKTNSDFDLVEPDVIKRIVASRGMLPDRPTIVNSAPIPDQSTAMGSHPTKKELEQFLKEQANHRSLARRLSRGTLVIRIKDFAAWLSAEKRKLKWPSQGWSNKRRPGRPSACSCWRDTVIQLVSDGQWNAQMPIAVLAKLLSRHGSPPSHDTVARIVDKLFLEKGSKDFLRNKPTRRRVTQNTRNSKRK